MPYKSQILKPNAVSYTNRSQNSQFFKGFSTVDDSKPVRRYDADLLIQDLLNQFNTKKGERVMNPTFGSIIWNALFEPFTPELQKLIVGDSINIVKSDPRIKPIQVNTIEQDQGIIVEINFIINSNNQTVNLKLNYNREIGLTSSAT